MQERKTGNSIKRPSLILQHNPDEWILFFGWTTRGILVPDQRLNPCPLQWKCGVLTTGLPSPWMNALLNENKTRKAFSKRFPELRNFQILLGNQVWLYQISFNYICPYVCPYASLLSSIQLFVTPWTVAHQAPRSLGFFRQENWSGLLFPSPMFDSILY